VQPSTAFQLPRLDAALAAGCELDYTTWALDPPGMEWVLAEVQAGRRLVVECGSGVSTVLIARTLRALGGGHVHSLEHLPEYADATRAALAADGLDAFATVHDAPLTAQGVGRSNVNWYAPAAVAGLPESGIQLLLVDGPPAGEGETEHARYPALPLLCGRLARGASAALDDVARAGERWVLDRWERELGVPFTRLDSGIAIAHSGWRRARLRAALLLRNAPPAAVGLLSHIGSQPRPDPLAHRVAELEGVVARLAQLVDDLEARSAAAYDRARLAASVQAVMAWIAHAELRSNPLISVITPSRERPERLERSIRSVLAQTYGNWELVVVANGDRAAEVEAVAASFADPRVRTERSERTGSSAPRNVGLDAARGELIAYLDDDNTMHPGWLKSVAWAFEQQPDREVVYGGWVIDDVARVSGAPGRELPELLFFDFDRELQRERTLADTSALAHRAGLDGGRWNETLPGFTDWEYLTRLSASREPLALPVIAAFYTTDAARRVATPEAMAATIDAVRELIHGSAGPVPG